MTINADAGESASGAQIDIDLMGAVDALNLALGGHAGTPNWTRELAAMAADRDCQINLHPGYPDRENFGRRPMPTLAWAELAGSLSRQRAVLPEIASCKFHGALYNESDQDRNLADQLADWCRAEGITTLIASPHGEMASAALAIGIEVQREGFADRRYQRIGDSIALVARSLEDAVLEDVDQVVAQVASILVHAEVPLLDGSMAELQCQTICVHGDGPKALEFAKAIRQLITDHG